ncbi:hypothetical protein NCS57_01175500 [Fusarium keratoplasticum]|uniref:Uncharacterized protein n=1 Tax=Fusarium keratoplasticum TaxID=1328300 RepID=A0ACC0QKY7_9HYPO|nr:hypothetical protein NCS57_01175500 [Fusarium keratoplasticum]KAI8657954.1 hypothetical protein NCS57_01175500 [Fusarium keratoplasticum]
MARFQSSHRNNRQAIIRCLDIISKLWEVALSPFGAVSPTINLLLHQWPPPLRWRVASPAPSSIPPASPPQCHASHRRVPTIVATHGLRHNAYTVLDLLDAAPKLLGATSPITSHPFGQSLMPPPRQMALTRKNLELRRDPSPYLTMQQ